MSTPILSGQDLIDALRIRLGGLSNAFTVEELMSFVQDGVQETWGVLKSLGHDYFGDSTQTSDSTQEDYGIALTTPVREYPLPANCREVRFIECTTVGFEGRTFEFRDFSSQDFQDARRAASSSITSQVATEVYFYTIFGDNQFILAQFPEAALTIKLWYIKSLDLITIDGELPSILHPFNLKIVDFALERAQLSARDGDMAMAWKEAWKEDVRMLVLTSGERESTNPIFITDFTG